MNESFKIGKLKIVFNAIYLRKKNTSKPTFPAH